MKLRLVLISLLISSILWGDFRHALRKAGIASLLCCGASALLGEYFYRKHWDAETQDEADRYKKLTITCDIVRDVTFVTGVISLAGGFLLKEKKKEKKVNVRLDVEIVDPNNNGVLDAGETFTLVCRVTNLMKRTAPSLKVKCELLSPEYEDEIIISKPVSTGKIGVWETKSVKITVRGGPHLHSGRLTIKVYCELKGRKIAEREYFIATRGKSEIYKFGR